MGARKSGRWFISVSGITSYEEGWADKKAQISPLVVSRAPVEPPFTYGRKDLFGPMKVKEDRKTVKRYGVVFTCLSMSRTCRDSGDIGSRLLLDESTSVCFKERDSLIDKM